MPPPTYPFQPRSNASLEAGQFWGIPLSDGRFACGRVLAVPRVPDPAFPVNARAFLAGLLDWVGDAPPTSETIAGAPLRTQGFVHIKAIRENGGLVLGSRPLQLDGIEPASWLSHPIDGVTWVYAGAIPIRPAGPGDAGLPVIVAWGFKLIERLAEQTFVRRPLIRGSLGQALPDGSGSSPHRTRGPLRRPARSHRPARG